MRHAVQKSKCSLTYKNIIYQQTKIYNNLFDVTHDFKKRTFKILTRKKKLYEKESKKKNVSKRFLKLIT